MFRWPSSLPLRPDMDSFVEDMSPDLLKQKMDVGPPKQRRRSTSGYYPIEASYTCDMTQINTFISFYENGCAGGSLPFEWYHPRLNCYITAYFSKYQLNTRDYQQHEIRISLLVQMSTTLLWSDEFWTNRAGGQVYNTPCEPGPYDRWVEDWRGGSIYIEDNLLTFHRVSGGVPDYDWHTQQVYSPITRLPRQAGRVGLFLVNVENDWHTLKSELGFNYKSTPDRSYPFAIYIGYQKIYSFQWGNATVAWEGINLPDRQWFALAVIQRTEGVYFAIRPANDDTWCWIGKRDDLSSSSYDLLRPSICSNHWDTMYVDKVRDVNLSWLPEPYFSDSFNTAGYPSLPDFKAHYEGVTGGIGAGTNSGKYWYNNYFGEWTKTGGRIRAATLDATRNLAVIYHRQPQLEIALYAENWRNTNYNYLIMNMIDIDNYVAVRLGYQNVALIKVKNGTPTVVESKSPGISVEDGATVCLARNREGKYWYGVFVANACATSLIDLGGGDGDYFAQGMYCGLMAYGDNTNEFDNYTCWPIVSTELQKLNHFI